MRKVIIAIVTIISCTLVSCVSNDSSNDGVRNITVDQSVLDSATVLVIDSTEQRFEKMRDALMLVYHDSIIIANNRKPEYREPLISIYELRKRVHHLIDYIPFEVNDDEMLAFSMNIIGDELFTYDGFYTRNYCTIGLRKPLVQADQLRFIPSGIEERGVVAIPYHDGLLVENPQCYDNEMVGIHNEVSRFLYYKHGKCQNPQEPTEFLVEDINTGADIHYNRTRGRACYLSHHQPFMELYDDSLHLLQRITFQSEAVGDISVGAPKRTMHQKRNSDDSRMSAKFDETKRVVGASNKMHGFLCSASDENHLYLVYCGKRLSFDYHTFQTYIIVMDWEGKMVNTYRYDRWIHSISPSSEPSTFYFTIYANDDANDATMKLVKVIPKSSIE